MMWAVNVECGGGCVFSASWQGELAVSGVSVFKATRLQLTVQTGTHSKCPVQAAGFLLEKHSVNDLSITQVALNVYVCVFFK